VINVLSIVEDLARRKDVDADRISVIELNRSGPSQAAVVLLAFLADRPDPIAFIKATSDRSRADVLEREFANLTRLARGGNEELRRSVPQPLYCSQTGDLTVLAETAKAGTRMKDFPPDRYFASRRFRNHFSLAVRWLVELHAALLTDASLPCADDAGSQVARYRDTHRVSRALDSLLDESVAALGDRDIPRAPSHGDFCAANIIPGDDGVFVIDWEYPLVRTWPLADLLYFISSTWCVPYRKGRQALKANYRQLFFASHRFSDLIRRDAAWYAGQLDVPPDLLLPLSAMCWTAYANRKYDELARTRAAGGEGDETGHIPLVMIENGACLNLELLAEHRDHYLLTSP
jgi:aminoglycoside phosphotransferase (APT) family kinase protein